jgi:hypothetical protein
LVAFASFRSFPAAKFSNEPVDQLLRNGVDAERYSSYVISAETMNAMPLRPASLVVAASDGPGG